jgi:uncharacterized protein YdhG (YjbR/CyaY superfamily)
MAQQAATVDAYINSCPDEVQAILREIRRRVRAAVPDTGETISYGIPTITRAGKHLIYIGAWKTHISVYPVPSGDPELDEELVPYRSRGTLKFGPQAHPIELIARVSSRLRMSADEG